MTLPIIVCGDAGHGRDSRTAGVYDSGAEGNGLRESDLSMAIINAGAWVAKTEYAGRIKFILTRDTLDESAPLRGRTAEAALEGAQYLISCHLNSASPAAQGIETFYRDGDAGDKRFATLVQASAVAAFGLPNRGLKTEADSQHPTLAILRGSTINIPACLIELGFITRGSDVGAIFGDDDRNKRIAFWRSVFDGILATTERATI